MFDYKRYKITHRWQFAAFVNAPRAASALIAIIVTLLEEMGEPVAWYELAGVFLANLLGILIVIWFIGEVAVSAMMTIDQWRSTLGEQQQRGEAQKGSASNQFAGRSNQPAQEDSGNVCQILPGGKRK